MIEINCITDVLRILPVMRDDAKIGQLVGYKHYGFWQCMDTLRDKKFLESIYKKRKNKSPWIK